ncbi:MAG: type IX secretion system protein PorQ [Cytophagaceae bacterium]|nr:type IX secretion system protein PorQ [Cytophagaceae bacterium]
MKSSLFVLVLIFAACLPAMAQRGGETVFDLLNLPQSARVASLGGNQVGLAGHDLAMLVNNPALLDSALSKQISINYTPYIKDINYAYGAYAHSFGKVGNFALGVYHVGYGDFTGRDETGIITGDFTVSESVLQLAYSRKISTHWHVGAALKPVFSRLETYNSWGMAFDAGMFYRSANGLTSAGIVVRNIGRQLDYYHETFESIKPDLQIGFSTKLAHAPFRFAITLQDLLTKSLLYTVPDENKNIAFADDQNASKDGFFDDVFRRFRFGVEFVPLKNFYVAGGFNPRMRHDLGVESKVSTVGFSWGFGLRIKQFQFAYGSARYHLAGTTNHFSITANLSSF